MLKTNKNKKKVLGVIGGMGSYASLDFYKKLIELTPANIDQDHLHIIIDSNAHIPSRSDAILYNTADPVPNIHQSLKMLENSGVDLIAIPCNTSHYYFSSFRSSITTPIVNIVESAVANLKANYPDIRYIGVLATNATIISGIYQKELIKNGFQPLILNEENQAKYISQAIHGEKGIKAGYFGQENTDLVLQACDNLLVRGAEAIIGACTELPLVISQENCPLPFIDSTKVLAQVCVNAMLMPEVYKDVLATSRSKQTVHSHMLL